MNEPTNGGTAAYGVMVDAACGRINDGVPCLVRKGLTCEKCAAGVKVDAAPLLGEIWMAFGKHEGVLVALPEYAAASSQAVGEKIMETARREGYRGSLRERIESLGWSVRRVTLAAGVALPDGGQRDA